MNEIKFVDMVEQYFGYLESDYHFTITEKINSNLHPETDGSVKYVSDTTVILIDSENGYVTLRFYRVKDDAKYYLTPIDIFEYLNTTNEEKELLLSRKSEDKSSASALFNRTSLLNQPGWKDNHGTLEDLDNELRNFANWLKSNARICLEGDFSLWPKLYEYKTNRALADHLRRGKDELGYVRVQDTDGTWKLIKQSIFKDKLEHVEKLRK